MSAASHAYAEKMRQLRQKAARVPNQETLNVYLLTVADLDDRKALFEAMEPYLPFPCATCPEGPAQHPAFN